MTTMPTAAVVALPSEQPTLAQQIARMEHQFAMAAPRGFEAQQIVRDALTALRQTPKLAECEPASVLGGLMTMAQLGLRIGVLGHGWLLPFWDSRYEWVDATGRKRKGAFRAQLIVGYLGMVELAYRSDRIAKITARVVHENDHFVVEYGANERLVHRPARSDRGAPVAYYATVRLKGADDVMFYDMSHDEMTIYRDRYAMAKKDGKVVGPWASEFDAMAKKTCLRQLAKYMPKGTDLARALVADESVRVDITPSAAIELVSEHPEQEDAPPVTPSAASEYGAPPTADDDSADQAWLEGAQ